MPKVERYGDPRVETRIARAPSASTPRVIDTSAPLIQGLSNLQAGIQTAKNELDDTQAEEALVAFEREKNDLFFNPDTGYFNSKGKAAYEGSEDINTALTKLQLKYSDGLTSADARKKYNSASNIHVTRAQASIGQHASTGLQDYRTSTINDRIENSIETATLHFNNDSELGLQLIVGENSVREQAQLLGLDETEALETYRSSFVSATINSAMLQDLGRANELMGRFGAHLEGEDSLVVATNLKKANLDADTLTISTQVMGAGDRTLQQMVDDVNELPTDTPEQVELKGSVMKQVKSQYTLNKEAREEAERENYEDYGKQIQDSDGQFSTRNIPGMDWEAMTVKQRSNLQKLEDDLKDDANDEALFSDLSLLSPDKLKDLDPNDYIGILNKSSRDSLGVLVRAARKPGSSVKTNTRTRAAITKDAMFNITREKPSDYSTDERIRANAINAELDERIERAIVENGGEDLDTEQLNKLVADFSRQTILKKPWYRFDVTLDINDVPAEAISQVSDLLIEAGIVVNNDTIAQFYSDNEDRF